MKAVRMSFFLIFSFLTSNVLASESNVYEKLFSEHQMSVVSVLVKTDQPQMAQMQPFGFEFPNNPFGAIPQNPQEPQLQPEHTGQGSGFIIDTQGYIVTNNHVIDGAKTITVSFDDGHYYPAVVVGRDAGTDVALLKINPPKNVILHPLKWGDSNALKPGAQIAAIGTPQGLHNSITSGILSAKDRLGTQYANYLQLDLALNPGNSGGPLLNLNGDVVGVNVAIGSTTGMYAGISYALPSNTVKHVVAQLKQYGYVKRALLGVSVSPVTPELASSFKLKTIQGALVNSVSPDSAAANAGIQPGDIILCFNKTKVKKVYDLPVAVGKATVGSQATLEVWRKQQKMTLSVMMMEDPNAVRQRLTSSHHSSSSEIQPASAFDKVLGMTLRMDSEGHGLVIEDLDIKLQQRGLMKNDVIVRVDSTRVTSVKQFKDIISSKDKDQFIALQVNRLDQSHTQQQFFVAIPNRANKTEG